MRVGIDAGGTLIKIAMEDDTHRTLSTELTTDINKVIQWLNQNEFEKINLTGVTQALLLKISNNHPKYLLSLMLLQGD